MHTPSSPMPAFRSLCSSYARRSRATTSTGVIPRDLHEGSRRFPRPGEETTRFLLQVCRNDTSFAGRWHGRRKSQRRAVRRLRCLRDLGGQAAQNGPQLLWLPDEERVAELDEIACCFVETLHVEPDDDSVRNCFERSFMEWNDASRLL